MLSFRFFLILLLIATSACLFVMDGDGTLTLINDSSFVIDELRLAERNDAHFGPDLSGQDSLFPGEVFAVELRCDEYDVLLIDEFGTPCTLYGIDVCSDGTLYRISDSLISYCGFTAGAF